MAKESLFKLTINPTFRDFKGRFAEADDNLLSDRRKQVKTLARQHVDYAQEEAPKKTGEFAKGIRFRSFVSGVSSLGYTISDPQPLGKWIREGTPPHPIPKPHGSLPYPLAFFWQKIGKSVVLWGVNHPGTKPNDYMGRANDRIEPEMDTTTAKISTRYVKMIAHGRTV